jgi:hypothetical protein
MEEEAEVDGCGDCRNQKTEELQRQKNSKDRRTPTTIEPQFF